MQVSGFLFGTAVRSDSPYKTFRDLMDAAKRRPGALTYSTSGIATTNHIAMEEILEREGAEMTHVPFRGSQEGVTALLGKQIDVVADVVELAAERRGRRAAPALRLDPRPRCRPSPTRRRFRELGYDMVVTSPYGIAGPKGMPPEIVDTLHRAFRKALEDEASQAIMRRWEMPREYLGPAEYLAFAKERVEYEKRMVARLKLSID